MYRFNCVYTFLMRTETLTLQHQELLEKRFLEMEIEISEYTFANLYLFRDVHLYEVVYSEDLYVKGKSRDGFSYLMPTSPKEKLSLKDIALCLRGIDFLFPIPQEWSPLFPSSQFQTSFLENDCDYFYSVEQMSTYAGRHLSGRRNLVKQFKEQYAAHQDYPLDKSRIKDALQVLEEWHEHAKEDVTRFTDYAACREALNLFERLHLTGHITYVDGKPIGILLGEPLNQKVYVIHFAKALIAYKGAYQYLYQTFAKTLENKYQMINLEQDLGMMELKHAKRAYLPDHLAIKLRIKPL